MMEWTLLYFYFGFICLFSFYSFYFEFFLSFFIINLSKRTSMISYITEKLYLSHMSLSLSHQSCNIEKVIKDFRIDNVI